MDMYSCECSKCGKMLASPRNRVAHEAKCDGSHAKQCPRCWKEFPNCAGKSRHLAKGTCVAVPKPPPLPMTPAVATAGDVNVAHCTLGDSNTIANTIDNSTTNIDNSVSNQVVVNVNDFHRTSARDSVNTVMRNPAPIQLANERQHDKLEEALAQAVYWGTPTNKNILGIESHGRNMFCQVNGKRGVIDRHEGTARMMGMVRQVSNAPEVRELLGPRVRLTDLTEIETPKDLAALRARYAVVVENGGQFGNSILVPERRPYFIPDDELRDLIVAATEKIYLHKTPPFRTFKEVVHKVCMRFGYADGRWFVGAGGLVNELSEAQVIHRLNDGYDSENDPTHYDPDREYRAPVPKKPHPSQEDLTKVGWQLVANPVLDLYNVPTYFSYIATEKIRLAINAIFEKYSIDRDAAVASVMQGIEEVRNDPLLISDATDAVLRAMKRDEGVPVNWDDYI
jgi:hypothetical protein